MAMKNGIPDAVAKQAAESEAAMEEAAAQAAGQSAVMALDEGHPDTPPASASRLESIATEQAAAAPGAAGTNQRLRELEQALALEQQRNRTLIGRIDAHRPELEHMRAEIEALKTSQASARPSVPAYAALLSEEERKEFENENEALGVSGRAVLGVMRNELGQLTSTLNAIRGELAQTQAAQASDAIWDRVEQMIPGAKAINTGGGTWLLFLEEVDAVSQRTYGNLAQGAYNAGDVQRLASIIETYQQRYGTADQANADMASLAGHLRPQRIRGDSAPAGGQAHVQEKPMLKESEITAFYRDLTMGKYDTNPTLAKRIEAEIDAANAEGRIAVGQ